MKKQLVFALWLTAISGPLLAQQTTGTKPEDAPKAEVPTTPQTQQVSDYNAALNLARFGYDNNNPLCLITAAEMIYKLGVTPLPSDARMNPTENLATDGKKAKPDLANPVQLLADARRLAKGNATLLALSNNVKPSRGAIGGPKSTTTRVQASDIDQFQIRFQGMASAIVALRGDGDTDLDLYIYDQNGNLVASDEDNTDYCVASWTPRYTGTFLIKVKNRGGVYNQYSLATN